MSNEDCPHGSQNCAFTCPSGGTWYACPEEPYFVGCCTSDPCTNSVSNTSEICPKIHAASFDGAIFNDIRPNSCIGQENDNWFTCNFTEPRFLGCCGVNPCANDGCPEDELLPAAWSSSRGDQFELFSDAVPRDDGDGGDEDGLSGGAIAGIVIGAVAGVLILLVAGWLLWRRKRKGQDGKGIYMPGHTRGVSGNGNSEAGGEYGYSMQQGSPYQDSHFSSPHGTAPSTASGTIKYPSGISGTSPSLSPPLPSESGRPVSEISGSDENWRYGRGSQNHGLGVFGAKPATIPELDSTSREPEVHELDGDSRR